MLLLDNKVVNLNTRFGYIVDRATIDYNNRVIANGGFDLTNFRDVIDYLVKEFKYEGLWGGPIFIYPCIGGNGATGSRNTFAVNLKSSSFLANLVNVTDAMCTATGYTGNGTNSYWRTGAFGSVDFTNDDTSLAFYSRSILGGGYDMGYQNSQNSLAFLNIVLTNYFHDAYSGSDRIQLVVNNALGFWEANRTSNVAQASYRNGILIGQRTITRSVSLANAEIVFGCRNRFDAATFDNFSAKNYAYFDGGLGYTAAQALKRYQIIQTVQRMLNRAV